MVNDVIEVLGVPLRRGMAVRFSTDFVPTGLGRVLSVDIGLALPIKLDVQTKHCRYTARYSGAEFQELREISST